MQGDNLVDDLLKKCFTKLELENSHVGAMMPQRLNCLVNLLAFYTAGQKELLENGAAGFHVEQRTMVYEPFGPISPMLCRFETVKETRPEREPFAQNDFEILGASMIGVNGCSK